MASNVCGIHHSSIIVSDVEKSVAFYSQVLGLTVDSTRPNLGYPGAWLQVGDQQIHLLELDNPDPVKGRPGHGGRDRHIALAVRSLDDVVVALFKEGCNFTLSKSGRKALFLRDPDANAIEVIEV